MSLVQLDQNTLLLTGLVVSAVVFIVHGIKKGNERRYPPGPPRDFLIGSARYFPSDHFVDAFANWARQYGDLVYAAMPGISMISVNSLDVAQELLNKRTNTTARRKFGYMAHELMGWNWSISALQPGETLFEQRKMLRRGIGPQRVASHDPLIERLTDQMMVSMKTFEGNPAPMVKSYTGQMVIQVTYGEEIWKTMGADLVAWNLEEIALIDIVFYGVWLVDIFPILRFIPSWMPGARFKRISNRSTQLAKYIRYLPFAKVKDFYSTGAIGHSLATDLIDEFGPVDHVRDVLATLYTAGSDTTTGAITAFINAMFVFPEIGQKVYEEITRVTRGDRLPRTSDRSNLPFTEAVWKESQRWKCPISLVRDEVINGYFIPKGSIINVNINWILNDPKVWGDPDQFRPERHLGEDAGHLPNPLVVIFGFGMRVCPGMYLADRMGFQIISAIMALYKVAPLEGRSPPHPSKVEFSDTAFRLPLGLECRFTIRDEKAANLLKAISLEE